MISRFPGPPPPRSPFDGNCRCHVIQVRKSAPIAEFTVPPPPMRGRPRPMPLGQEEGELCGRDQPGFLTCIAKLVMRHSRELDGCRCFISPPCGYCMSEVPECPVCGWRAEEPS